MPFTQEKVQYRQRGHQQLKDIRKYSGSDSKKIRERDGASNSKVGNQRHCYASNSRTITIKGTSKEPPAANDA
jgi:hypothetical protein